MTFEEALIKLNIADYSDRIINSNSHGKLFHLMQYIQIAESSENKEDFKWFRKWFEELISFAEKEWERPESIFQHILKILIEK